MRWLRKQVWKNEKAKLEDERTKAQNGLDDQRMLNDGLKKRLDAALAQGGTVEENKGKLNERVAILELNESRLARQHESVSAKYEDLKAEYDEMESDKTDRERFFREKIAALDGWKQRAAVALRRAHKAAQQSVPATEAERIKSQLQVHPTQPMPF